MKLTVFKIAGVLGGAVVASTGAYGVYHFASFKSNEVVTIGSKLNSYFKGTNTVFLTENHEEWSRLGARYNVIKNKPKKEDGRTDLTLDEVKEWCTVSVNKSFKTESDGFYQQVKEICFLNVKTLLGELNKASLKHSGDANHADWQNSWESYKNDSTKESKGLKINDSEHDSDLNGVGTNKSKGGPALHAWCTKTKDKKMYDAESLLPVFKAWCV